MNEIVNANNILCVGDFIPTDGSKEVSSLLQQIIDENPNRTIYFPDGVYYLNKPICTPADPKKSVSLLLSDFAVLKATKDWSDSEAMIRLGGKDPMNTITENGSNYSFCGGIVDGSGVASGISIDSGRETAIRNVSIKHTKVGIRIKYGANWGSSDADIFGVNIVGNDELDSIGVWLEGFDNTLTNMRIAHVQVGLFIDSSGNLFRNLHPLYTVNKYEAYSKSCGFKILRGGNFFDNCYSDHFATGFDLAPNIACTFDSCFCMWYNANGETHAVVRANGQFNSVFTNLKIGFNDKHEQNVPLIVEKEGGKGFIENIIVREQLISDERYKEYFKGVVLPAL